jgi:Lsr2
MARQVTTVITDDLDGSPEAVTVKFAYEGIEYEIDLAPGNRQKLAEFLLPHIDKGRRIGRTQAATSGRRNGQAKASGNHTVSTRDVRAWAQAQGIEIANRGRVPKDILVRYQKENSAPVA